MNSTKCCKQDAKPMNDNLGDLKLEAITNSVHFQKKKKKIIFSS